MCGAVLREIETRRRRHRKRNTASLLSSRFLFFIADLPPLLQNMAADHRADLYSLGVMYFQHLTASLPFENEGLVEVIHAILTAL